jgi:hypothetical protein
VRIVVVAVGNRKHFGRMIKSVHITRGRAGVVFVLSRKALGANHLVVRASAGGVLTVTSTLRLYHPRRPGTSAGSGFKVAPPS